MYPTARRPDLNLIFKIGDHTILRTKCNSHSRKELNPKFGIRTFPGLYTRPSRPYSKDANAWKPNLTPITATSNSNFTSQLLKDKIRHDDDSTIEQLHDLPTEGDHFVKGPKSEDSSESKMWQPLFEKLASHRKRLAAKQNVPAYVIASNKILEQLAKDRPTDTSQLLKIKGIGDRKAEAYGDEWLEIIAQDIAKHPRESIPQTKPPSESKIGDPAPHHLQDDYQEQQQESDSFKELYRRLAEHRKACAEAQDKPFFAIAHNSHLESLARKRPSNRHELLGIPGISTNRVDKYGSDWLRIIAEFNAEDGVPTPYVPTASYTAESTLQPQLGDQPSKGSRIKNIGRSKEILLSQPLSSSELPFQDEETKSITTVALAKEEYNNSHDGPSVEDESKTLIEPQTSPQPKHKSVGNPEDTQEAKRPLPFTPDSNTAHIPQLEKALEPKPLSLEQVLLRKKLDAYAKSVIWAMDPKPTQPIVSEDTLQYLVTMLPQTIDELHQIPNIQGFIEACEGAGKDLWRTYSTWIRASRLIRSP
ncbi:HRDC-domain-containing protein [Daldinia sp. FL1419]|nr:HRDC-domain-containing protein [Daldinia sp. FL1419]